MKDLIPIPKEIYDAFEKASPMFLVTAIKEQMVYPKQPPQAKFISFHVGSIDELNHAINNEGLRRFDVWEIKGKFSQEALLRRDAEQIAAEKQEADERALYARLDAKYGKNKMEVVND